MKTPFTYEDLIELINSVDSDDPVLINRVLVACINMAYAKGTLDALTSGTVA